MGGLAFLYPFAASEPDTVLWSRRGLDGLNRYPRAFLSGALSKWKIIVNRFWAISEH